jgi:hypothetical protein
MIVIKLLNCTWKQYIKLANNSQAGLKSSNILNWFNFDVEKNIKLNEKDSNNEA